MESPHYTRFSVLVLVLGLLSGCASLGVTEEDAGQRWLKALISIDDGLRPGEPGFLRQFALPKTVAIRTLRHGADLELV